MPATKSLFHTETINLKKSRMKKILRALLKDIPEPECALEHEDPLQLLVATILSAQCTDERVNKVTPNLFAAYPDAKALSEAPLEKLMEIIHSTGFFQNKAKSIKACATQIVEQHKGVVPKTMEELTGLAGVGRKTANVILGTAFGIPGLPVDTHVKRIAMLLQFTDSENPEIIEQHLCGVIPKKDWTKAGHVLILHGRKTCIARRPKCDVCVIAGLCPSAMV
jgi:endonuclease III